MPQLLTAHFLLRSLTLIVALLISSLSVAQTQFTATVDRNSLAVEETLTLKLRFHEQVMFGEPDISQLENNFNILGKHRNQQYRSINGKAESWTQWQITLAPKREGKLLIPSFSFKKSFSEAIEIQVNKATIYTGKSADQPVFMEVDVDKSSVFVQEQVLYTVRLFTSINLHSLNKNEPDVKNALVKKISENQFQKTVNGVPYVVIEIQYAYFPQQSGQLSIPSTLWSVVTNQQSRQRDPFMRDPFFGRGGKKINLRAPERIVTVLPQPSNYTADTWVPAQDVSLQQSWSQAPSSFKVGEPITRTIRVKAKGITSAQLPPLTIDPINGVSYYPDQPQSDEQLGAQGVTTVKQESYAIVANQAGTITLPAISMQWWDTNADRMRETRLPIQEITVAPADAQSTPHIAETPSAPVDSNTDVRPQTTPGTQTGSIWLYTNLLSAVTAVLFLILWLRARAVAPTPPTTENVNVKQRPNVDHKSLLSTLDEGDPRKARAALIEWGKEHFQHPELHSLSSLGERSNNPEFRDNLLALDNQIYGNEEQRLPPALVEALKSGLEKVTTTASATHAASDPLPSLYG